MVASARQTDDEALAEVDVVLGLELEFRLVAPAPNLDVVVLVGAGRHVGSREVRDLHQPGLLAVAYGALVRRREDYYGDD